MKEQWIIRYFSREQKLIKFNREDYVGLSSKCNKFITGQKSISFRKGQFSTLNLFIIFVFNLSSDYESVCLY